MIRFVSAALLAATVAGTPALAQDYGRPGYAQPSYGYTDPRNDNGNHDSRFDDRYGYETSAYDRRDDDRRDDNRYRDNRGYNDRGRYLQQRGEGWSVLRAAIGPDRSRDPRFTRATLQSFDRNRDGILTRYEGWAARRALTQRTTYGQRW